jgi:magnesium-protoporphyrin IX monomethyl ester (oxidative) cyclase
VKFEKVVCIYPYFREVPIYEFFPPIGLEYIAAAIEDLVDDVRVVDLRFEKDLHGFLRDGADMFCVSVNWHYEFDSVCELIRALPKDATTVVGGRHATANVQQLFDACPNIDVIVRGDGEATMREVVASGSPEHLEALSYRRNGKVIHNANRTLRPVSNTLFPNREARRYKYRISYQKVGLGYGVDSVVSSRGCPFNCRFCSFNRNPLGQRRTYSERTPESVIAELRRIPAKIIAFLDDNFFVNLKRAEEICDLLIKEKLNKKFIVNARVSIGFQPILLEKMYRAGFRLLMIGIESAQDKSLKALDKGFTTADVRNAFKGLRKSNMLTSGYFIVGIIDETMEDMIEIASFAEEIGLDLIHLNRLRYERYSGLGDLRKCSRF